MTKRHPIKNRIYSLVLSLVLILACLPFAMFDFGEVKAAEVSKEVTTLSELRSALANSSYTKIIVAADITIPYSTTNSKSSTAYLTADRNVTIEGKDGHPYVIKREAGAAADQHSKSILEVWGNGTYDGITVNIYDLVFDGGANWKTTDAQSRYAGKKADNNTNTRSTQNSGAYGRAIIDVANKGTLNLESGAVVQNGDTTTNSTTRVSTGTAPISGSANYGGGVRVDFQTGGTVNLKAGSTIKDCCAWAWGGGIGAYNYARLNLYGGKITNCASACGGGIAVTYRGNTATNTAGTIKVFGGEISNCYSPDYGAALAFTGAVSCYLLGGTFTNNKAANANGGGVLYADYDVTVYLSKYSYFSCSGNTSGNYSNSTLGWTTSNGIYTVTNKATIKTAPVYTVTFKNGDATYTTLQCSMGTSLGAAFPGDPHKTNSIFHGWYNGSTLFTKDTQVQSSLTVTAKWHTHAYSYEADGNVIKLICSGENDCPYKENIPKLTLTGSTTKVYDRQPFTGIRLVDDISALTNSSQPEIFYTKNGEDRPLSGAPMDIGEYKANVTVGGETAMLSFSITREDPPTYEMEPLYNKGNSEGKLINHISGGVAHANLRLYIHDSSDTINLYKIAEVVWSSTNDDYYDPQWVGPVASWISESSYATQQSHLDPLTIADSSSSVQSDFFNTMLAETSSVFTGDEPLTALTGLSVSGPADDPTYNRSYLTYSNLEPGVYAAVSSNTSSTPCVVSILPKRYGPSSAWYLEDTYEASMKSAAAKVNKFINSEDFAETVEIGETVTFKIEFSLTSLYTDRITLSATDGTVKDYTLNAVDKMSAAYSMVKDENDNFVLPTLKYYIKNDNESDPVNLETIPATQNFNQFADSSYQKTSGESSQLIDEDHKNLLYSGPALYDTYKAQGKAIYAINRTAPIYTISEPNVVNGITTFEVDYNVNALKGFINDLNTSPSNVVFVLTYQAVVTDQIKVNSEENTNRITLNYEKTKDIIDQIDDVVYGFTYGLNVIKVDGDTINNENPDYLKDAKFRLYKEVSSMPEAGTISYVYDDEDKGKRYFVLCTTAYLGPGNSYDSNGCFTSVRSAEGIKLSGLKEGHYVLEEFDPPPGYNKLAEDLYFEINRLPAEVANETYNGFLKSFVELKVDGEDAAINDTGYVRLEVLNFQGLTLPSTGGAGTLIFTIIGLFVMFASITIILASKNKRHVEYYL